LVTGLCDTCAHQKLIGNTRGSTFSLCLRSRVDPAYPKYPPIPVRRCPGHTPVELGAPLRGARAAQGATPELGADEPGEPEDHQGDDRHG
jgi:hypothetical protein